MIARRNLTLSKVLYIYVPRPTYEPGTESFHSMESNKEEAIRCLAIAKKHNDSSNYASAIRFCQKSISLFSTPEAEALLSKVTAKLALESKSEPSTSKASATEEHPSSAGVKHRHTTASQSNGTAGGSGGDKRDYTPEQGAVVKRVRACKATQYYEILAVKKDCEEAEVKKAYRKVRVRVLHSLVYSNREIACSCFAS